MAAIYELGRGKPDVGIRDIARALSCSKASATKMTGILMDMSLLVRERYGKACLADTGFLPAKNLLHCAGELHARFPAIGLGLTEEESQDLVRTIVVNMPERCRKRPAERDSAAGRKPCAAVLFGGV